MFKIILFLLSVLQIKIVYSSDWILSRGNTTVRIEKQSGTVTVSNDANEIVLKLEKIEEKADNGITPVGISGSFKHHFLTYEYQYFVAKPEEFIEVQARFDNITGLRRNFTAVLVGPAAKLDMDIVIMDNYTLTENNDRDEYFEVFNGTVKIGYRLSNWKFCGVDQVKCMKENEPEFGRYLDFYFSVKGNRMNTPERFRYDRARTDMGSRKPETYDYGGGDITFSQKYHFNESWHQLNYGYPKLLTSGDVNYVIVRYPVFEKPVYFDYYITLDTNAFNTTSSASSFNFVNLHHSLILFTGSFLSLYISIISFNLI